MVTVSDDATVVENDLSSGRLTCPDCGSGLARWGWARTRPIREGTPDRTRHHRPRRARCTGCGVTHVLLSVVLAARRADGAAVIAAAVEANTTRRWGHRRIAAWLGRPASTVRGWLRAFAASASVIAAAFLGWTARDAPDAAAVWPAPAAGQAARALQAVNAYAAGIGDRFAVGAVTWVRAGITATAGRLFTASWWAEPLTALTELPHFCSLKFPTPGRSVA